MKCRSLEVQKLRRSRPWLQLEIHSKIKQVKAITWKVISWWCTSRSSKNGRIKTKNKRSIKWMMNKLWSLKISKVRESKNITTQSLKGFISKTCPSLQETISKEIKFVILNIVRSQLENRMMLKMQTQRKK